MSKIKKIKNIKTKELKISLGITKETLDKINEALINNPQFGEKKRQKAKEAIENSSFIKKIIGKKTV
ncbi:MAG: hypothetical protein MUE85_15230 [Microscillaceae bacterium]|jgi:hypothetical protein|nr:hypothetical protein [Microscillaceae bacterium]